MNWHLVRLYRRGRTFFFTSLLHLHGIKCGCSFSLFIIAAAAPCARETERGRNGMKCGREIWEKIINVYAFCAREIVLIFPSFPVQQRNRPPQQKASTFQWEIASSIEGMLKGCDARVIWSEGITIYNMYSFRRGTDFHRKGVSVSVYVCVQFQEWHDKRKQR